MDVLTQFSTVSGHDHDGTDSKKTDVSTLTIASQAVGDIIYASSTTVWARLATSATATRYLANTGSSNIPAWAQVNLADGVTGTLPTGNGGTGATAAANAASGVVVLDGSSKLPAVDGSQVTGIISQVNDVETTGVQSTGAETTLLSVAKTITSGKTVFLMATGYTSGAVTTIIKLKYTDTTVQTVTVGTGDTNHSWAVSAIVTGLSGAITFSVTHDPDGTETSYGNLTVLEF